MNWNNVASLIRKIETSPSSCAKYTYHSTSVKPCHRSNLQLNVFNDKSIPLTENLWTN
ncbi:hypothetical protein G9L54_000252 [Enterococcus faecium]|nr:hypothetical protein [Enterococcus faecium]